MPFCAVVASEPYISLSQGQYAALTAFWRRCDALRRAVGRALSWTIPFRAVVAS